MEEKGKIYKEQQQNDYQSQSSSFKIDPIQLYEPNFCPQCGNNNLTLERIICFGIPGSYWKAECRDCGHKF